MSLDNVIVRPQRLEGDALLADRLRLHVQNVADGLLRQTTIPAVKEQLAPLDELAGDTWWVDVTLPMLELARRRVRGLVRFLDKVERRTVYTDFQDELGDSSIIDRPGTDWERFRAKARAYLREHEDRLALQRLKRNHPLTPDDLMSLEEMLLESGAGVATDITRSREESHGLGLLVRSLVGLNRSAAMDALGAFLDGTTYTAAQIDFVGLIVSELTENGVMEARRLYE